MSRVRFLRGTVLGFGQQAEPGEVVEFADEREAVFWVRQERAEFVDGTALPEDPGILQSPDGPKPKAARTR